jgi:hypothetical protein
MLALVDFINLDNIRVIELLEDVELLRKLFFYPWVYQDVLLKYLYCSKLATYFMTA